MGDDHYSSSLIHYPTHVCAFEELELTEKS